MITSKFINSIPDSIRQACTAPAAEGWGIVYNVKAEEVEIRLDGVVGDEYTQSDAASISKVLRANKGKPVTLRVNSGGGLAFDGVAIHNALAEHDGPTVGIVESLAASAAAVAVMGADTVKMFSNASFMIHESIGLAYGHAWEIRNLLEWMDRLDTQIAQTLADRTGLSMDVVTEQLKGKAGDGTVFTADEALKAGYVNEIISVKKAKNDTDNRLTAYVRQLNLKQRQLKARSN